MTDVSKCESEVSLHQGIKRCRKINNNEDFDNRLDDNDDLNASEEQSKRFKGNDSGEDVQDNVDSVVEESSSHNSIVETCKQDVIIDDICKALRDARDIFTFDELDDDQSNNLEKSTELDGKIRAADIPERMQLRRPPITAATEEELIEEAKWIYNQAFYRRTMTIQDSHLTVEAKLHTKKGPETESKIKITLELMRNRNLEIPFIAFYRKEYILPELNIHDLWKIYKFDGKWCELKQRKKVLLNLFRMMKKYQFASKPISKHTKLIEYDDIEQLENVETVEELNDFYQYFMFHYGLEISKIEGKEEYTDCEDSYFVYRKVGLASLARKFGLSSKQFARNLSQERQVHQVEKESAIPCVLALNYINDKLRTTDEVLQAAQHMMATEISKEPLVRKTVRKVYMKNVKISVRPTNKGIEMIDENHPIYTMKYIKDKPIKDLVGGEYLKLAMAKKDRLITISFSDQIEENYVERMKQLHSRKDTDKHSQDWNTLRLGIIDQAITKILIPDLKKELHTILLNESKDCVMRQCTRQIYNWIKISPYNCNLNNKNNEWDSSEGVRVMGVAYVRDLSVAAFACMISSDGQCTDYLNLPNLLRMNDVGGIKTTMNSVVMAIKNLIVTKKPHVIAISGESSDALTIAQEFREIVSSIVATERHFPKISVEIVDNQPAVVYANSHQGATEFPGYSVVLRQAISLARCLQDPLVEFSQLCNDDDEILCLKLDKLQDQLSKKDLLDNLHLEFVNRVNEVGVDVNKSVQKPYFGKLLQFVCGFGPRKAKYLMETLKQTNQCLENRQQLITLGQKVFKNCAGFIKIDTSNITTNSTNKINILDGTRVHPEDYDWAGKIATEALDFEFNTTNASIALKKITNFSDKLKELDLDTFAKELASNGFVNKCVTIYDIRSELTHRYKDLRIPYKSPTADKLFGIFVKETPTDFHVGKLVEATIIGVTNSTVWIRLDNRLSGYIHINNLSDERIANPMENIRIGSRIHCRIIQIDTDKFCIEASSRGSDLIDRNGEWRLPKDPCYDSAAEAKDELFNHRARNMQQLMDAKRTITHKCFKNVNCADSERLMQTMNQGAIIIRPSSKGEGYLTFTWKVTDNVIQHVPVSEENGKLLIGEESFQDFDDIIGRYINPMAKFALELLKFKHYKPQVMGKKELAEKMIRELKKANPFGIPYIISVVKDNLGNFLLSYYPRDQCRHINITVIPTGYKLNGYRFARLDDLIYWFKEHSKDLIPGQNIPNTSRVCRTMLDVKMDRINPEVMQNDIRNLSDTMLHSQSQVENYESYYPHK